VSAWYEHWFGEEYLELYTHRDERDAERVVGLLVSEGYIRPGDAVLDLACGAGRHAAALSWRGAVVTGLDLSLPLLRAAQCRAPARLIRGDMRRLPLRGASFAAVVNLFTSFGYFDDDAQHAAVLGEVARVLRAGGAFALDFLNAPHVRTALVPRDERTEGGRTIVQERRLVEGGRYVEKAIHVAGEGRSFLERVRLYERADLERMLAAAGLPLADAYGDYSGTPHSPGSPRLILVARRAA
jgi:SAM-dependent methyltransferase